VIYSIRQVTTYRYGASVPFARHLLRLTPVSRGDQTVLSSTTIIEPAVYERREGFDFFGNHVTHVGIEAPHQSFEVLSRSEVRVAKPAPVDPASTPAWEDIAVAATQAMDLGPASPVHFIFSSRYVPLDAAIRDYAGESFVPGRPVLAAGVELMQRIRDDFAYDPDATETSTPIAEAFAKRHGVCQDFAHIMISGLRGLGLPAAYVSGYLRTEPPPGQPRLEGADATHAWVSLWCGDEHGWQGLDPTNAVRTGSDHIVLAIGRDFADVSPLDGVILVGAGHKHTVAVTVVPHEDVDEGEAHNPRGA
jgi:transglutaminase-like putative cysteine protease